MLEPMRWSNDKSTRFQALREQDARGALSPADRAELDARSTLERLRKRSAALAEDYLRVMGHELAPAR